MRGYIETENELCAISLSDLEFGQRWRLRYASGGRTFHCFHHVSPAARDRHAAVSNRAPPREKVDATPRQEQTRPPIYRLRSGEPVFHIHCVHIAGSIFIFAQHCRVASIKKSRAYTALMRSAATRKKYIRERKPFYAAIRPQVG